MAQDIVVPEMGQLPAIFANVSYDADELGAGIVGGFGVVSYRGKVWRVKHRGNEEDLLNENGDPVASVEVVMIKAAPHLAKIYYDGGFQDGAAAKPDCWSSNAVNPDPTVPNPVAQSCALCPNNAFGSRVTENGKAAKACSDHKRSVIVPLADMANEAYGGPMLLRIPAASLRELAAYSQQLKQAGYPYFGVATRISFDRKEAFPKLLFKAIRLLTQEEAQYIISMRNDPQVLRILNEEPEAVAADRSDEGQSNGLFEQPPEKPAPKAAAPKPAPAPAPKPAPAPVRAAAPPPAPAPAPAPVRAVAKPVSPIGAAVAKPVQARPAPAPAPEPEEGASGVDDMDAALDALLS